MCADLFQIYVWKIKSSRKNPLLYLALNIWWRLRPQSFYLKTINRMKSSFYTNAKRLIFNFFCNLDEIWPLYIDFKINTTQLSLLLLHKTESLTLSLILWNEHTSKSHWNFRHFWWLLLFTITNLSCVNFVFFCIAEVFMCMLAD